ncbi:hypothetical protein [Amycolatopsis anabasis]|uniref:hypothetical protein n=1 Tax=Amycolatopsis anabasis TaxID=1840409 RepID=UPI00131BAE48|nr:hypothetical protein [Amycolatopsis anabasis]
MENATGNYQEFDYDAFEQQQAERRKKNVAKAIEQLPTLIEEEGEVGVWMRYLEDGEEREAAGEVFALGDGTLNCKFDMEVDVLFEDIVDITLD